MYLVSSQRENKLAAVPEVQLAVLSVPKPGIPDPAEQGKPSDRIPLPDGAAVSSDLPEQLTVEAIPVPQPGLSEPSPGEEQPAATPLADAPLVPETPLSAPEETALPSPSAPEASTTPVAPVAPVVPEVEPPAPTVEPRNPKVISGVVAKGDSASRILTPYISEASVQQLVSATQKIHPLTQIHVGQPYTLVRSPESKDMERFEYEIDDNKRLVVKRTTNGLEARVEPIQYEYDLVKVSGTIRSSLFGSLASAGESPILAVSIADIFGSEINFIKDLRSGDTFSLLIEKRYRDNKFKNYGKILAATFTNQGKTYDGFLFAAEHGMEAYYNAKGESLKKTLLKAPLAFTRISSGYSMNRKHPVFFDSRPHQGVDYAAPSGTPVKAVGDGVVQKSGWGNGFGNMVIIGHVGGLESMYSHLSGFARGLKQGQRVKQGQVVGYVGATGVATGPHLDFRLKQNGKYVNPTKAVNPRGGPVPQKLMSAFKKQKNLAQSYLNGKRAVTDYERGK